MITAERLRELLDYDPLTGVFLWRVKGRRHLVGCRTPEGYVTIGVDGKNRKAHRLAWLHYYGTEPPEILDHRNMDGTDNRICNLRAADNSMNNANRRLRPQNSGVKGITQRRKTSKWVAQIQIGGKKRSLGTFLTPAEAASAYRQAASMYFGDFARFE